MGNQKIRYFQKDELNIMQDRLDNGVLPITLATELGITLDRMIKLLDRHGVSYPIQTRWIYNPSVDRKTMGSCMYCTNIENDVNKHYQMFRMKESSYPVSLRHAVYVANIGPVPDGMLVKNKCGSEKCIYTEHLFLVSRMEDMRKRHIEKAGSENKQMETSEPQFVMCDMKNPDAPGNCYFCIDMKSKNGMPIRDWMYFKEVKEFDREKYKLKEKCGNIMCCASGHMELVPIRAYNKKQDMEEHSIRPEYEKPEEGVEETSVTSRTRQSDV